MAAPLKFRCLRIPQTNLKFIRSNLLNLSSEQKSTQPLIKHRCDRTLHCQNFGKHAKLKGFTSIAIGISGFIAGLSIFKCYGHLFRNISLPHPFQEVYASSADILKTAGNNFIADAVDIAAPAVVFLRVKRYSRYGLYEESQGSGFIVRSDGLILTNAHVVRENGQITVKMKDGREFTGTVQSVDRVSDLATIKVNASNLPVIKLGDSSKLRAGEWVVALGCPLSLNFTVTVGIVSSKHRAGEEIGFRNRDDIGYIQTDAAITVGNSGGPLINLAGEAIGINTWTVKDGISFAIPSDYAKKFIERADAYAQKTQKSSWFSRGSETKKHYYLGITMLTLTPDLVVALREQYAGFPPDCDHGVIVHSLKIDSPAFRAGLKGGDVIMEINGQDVKSASDVYGAVNKGEELTLTVKRHTQTLKLRVTPLEVH